MSSSEDENKVLKFLLVIVLSPFATILSGYVFSRLWLWSAGASVFVKRKTLGSNQH